MAREGRPGCSLRVRDGVGDAVPAAGAGLSRFPNLLRLGGSDRSASLRLDPGRWIRLESLPETRVRAVFNGEILVIGGEGNGQAYTTVEALDPLTDTWRTLGSLNHARHGTQAIVSGGGVFVADERVRVCGVNNRHWLRRGPSQNRGPGEVLTLSRGEPRAA
jgi:hypothetical protein